MIQFLKYALKLLKINGIRNCQILAVLMHLNMQIYSALRIVLSDCILKHSLDGSRNRLTFVP